MDEPSSAGPRFDDPATEEAWQRLMNAPVRWNLPTPFLGWSGDYSMLAEALKERIARKEEEGSIVTERQLLHQIEETLATARYFERAQGERSATSADTDKEAE